MNPFAEITIDAAVQAWGWTLIHFLWQGTLIGVFVGCLLRGLPLRPACTRSLGLQCGLIALAVCPFMTFAILLNSPPASSFSVVPLSQPRIELFEDREPFENAQSQTQPGLEVARHDATPAKSPIVAAREELHLNTSATPSRFRLSRFWLNAIVLTWALGVFCFAARLLGGYWLLQQDLSRRCRPLCDEWLMRAEALATSLGVARAVRWLESISAQVPFTCGWLRPVVVLPVALLTTLSPREVECLIAHELIHLRRHDALVNLLQCVLEAVLFYHPVVWWLSARLRHERELICDELAAAATGDRIAYSRALLAAGQLAMQPRSLALAATDGELKQRVQTLLGLPVRTARVSPVAALLSVGLALGSVGLMLVFTQPASKISRIPLLSAVLGEMVQLEHGKFRLPIVAGEVVNSAGLPVAGVTVFLRESHRSYTSGVAIPGPTHDLARTQTTADGQFQFPKAFAEHSNTRFDVIAVKDGSAIAWQHFSHALPQTTVRLVLQPEEILRGELRDADGRPVAGAKVSLRFAMSIRHITQADLDQGRWPRQDDDNYLNAYGFRESPEAMTDSAGKFELRGLPANRGLLLFAEHPRFAGKEFYAATVDVIDAENASRAKRLVQTSGGQVDLGIMQPPLLEVGFDAENQPVIAAPYKEQFVVKRSAEDEDQLIIEPSAGGGDLWNFGKLTVHVTPPSRGSSLMEFTETFEHQGAAKLNIPLRKGVRVAGQVVNQKTGAGVPDVQLRVHQLPPHDELVLGKSYGQLVKTDSDGVYEFVLRADQPFRVNVDPPFGFLNGASLPYPPGVSERMLSQIIQSGSTAIENWTFQLLPVPLQQGLVTDDKGRPAAGVAITGELTIHSDPNAPIWRESPYPRGRSYFQLESVSDAEGHFELDLNRAWQFAPPGTTVELVFRDWSTNLSRRVEIDAPLDASQPVPDLTVQLQQMGGARGRFINRVTGDPVVGQRVTLYHEHSSGQSLSAASPEIRTGRDGRFDLRGVDIEGSYFVFLQSDKRFRKLNRVPSKLHFNGQPGELVDIGDIALEPVAANGR